MSERERWIVYPLLFLALGAALRDKLAKQTRTKQIVCEQLSVVDSDGRPRAQLSGSDLRLDLAGPGEGLVSANVVQAQALFEGRRRVSATPSAGGMGVSWPQLLRLFQQMGLLRVAPPSGPAAAAPEPAPPPAAGPRLVPPREAPAPGVPSPGAPTPGAPPQPNGAAENSAGQGPAPVGEPQGNGAPASPTPTTGA